MRGSKVVADASTPVLRFYGKLDPPIFRRTQRRKYWHHGSQIWCGVLRITLIKNVSYKHVSHVYTRDKNLLTLPRMSGLGSMRSFLIVDR